jgi:hypothetical protein
VISQIPTPTFFSRNLENEKQKGEVWKKILLGIGNKMLVWKFSAIKNNF